MSLKKLFINRDILHRDDTLAIFKLNDLINKEERVTVWKYLLNGDRVVYDPLAC